MEIVWEMTEIDCLKTCKICLPKVVLLKIPMNSVQYNTEHYGMHDDRDNEHGV